MPPALAALVRRLLEKAPDARFHPPPIWSRRWKRSAAHADLGPLSGTSTPPRSPQVSSTWTPRRGARTDPVASPRPSRSATSSPAGWFYRRAPRPPAAPRPLAILPFRSLPDSADSQLLELGLADVFISRLNQLRTSACCRSRPPSGARHRPPGSGPHARRRSRADRHVAAGRGRVRASVQLLSISEEPPIWSDHVRRRCGERLLHPGRRRRAGDPGDRAAALVQRAQPARRTGTRNSEAYESNLRGRADTAQVKGADIARATESFRQAVTLDPDYADAWAALGAAYRRLPLAGTSAAGRVHRGQARGRTSARDRTRPRRGAVVLGTVAFWYEWDYPRAEALLRRAVARHRARGIARVPGTSPLESRAARRGARGDSPRARAWIRTCRSPDRSRASSWSWLAGTRRRSRSWMPWWSSRRGSFRVT